VDSVQSVHGVMPRDVRVQFEALLIAPMLEPLAGETDAVGQYGMDLFARAIAARLEPS
jgi:hypothetical protein